jgi:[acyl-carrier-protein] S-malonyltransferase
MASVLGLSRGAVEEACAEASDAGLVRPANFNSPGQVVISGEKEAVAKASEIARAKGARRVVPLRVSGGFHTALMEPAAQGLAETLAGVEITRGRFPVVANATAGFARGADEVRRTLVDQLTNPVLFEDCVRKLAADGVTRFVELGPGKVLSGLVRRTEREAELVALGTAEAIREFAAS